MWVAGEAMDSRLLVALAYTGFLLNLFNLIPVRPLDGGVHVAVRLKAAPARHIASTRPVRRSSGAGSTRRQPHLRGPRSSLLVLGMVATHVEQNRL